MRNDEVYLAARKLLSKNGIVSMVLDERKA